MLRRHSLERRLFGWLLALALVPPLIVLALALTIGAGSLGWMGTLGPWDQYDTYMLPTDDAGGN